MSVQCLPFPCFTPCKQYLSISTFTNGPFSHGRNLNFFSHQNFFGIIMHIIRTATDGILGVLGWAASSQDSLPASYRLCKQGLSFAASAQGLGQHLPYIQPTLEQGRGPLPVPAQQPGDKSEGQHSAPLHPTWAPSQPQPPDCRTRTPPQCCSRAEPSSHPVPETCPILKTWKQRYCCRGLGNVI